MRRIMILVTLSWISLLAACSTFSSNVTPENGPTMEEVYDGMGHKEETNNENDFISKSVTRQTVSLSQTFRKLPNPELTMYVFPHLAGKEEVPIPGYYTAFSAYTQTHYAQINEMIRE